MQVLPFFFIFYFFLFLFFFFAKKKKKKTKFVLIFYLLFNQYFRHIHMEIVLFFIEHLVGVTRSTPPEKTLSIAADVAGTDK